MAGACSRSTQMHVPPSPGRPRTPLSQSTVQRWRRTYIPYHHEHGKIDIVPAHVEYDVKMQFACAAMDMEDGSREIIVVSPWRVCVCLMHVLGSLSKHASASLRTSLVPSPTYLYVSLIHHLVLTIYPPTKTSWLISTLLSLHPPAPPHSVGLTSKPCTLPLLPCGLARGPPATPRT
jgi:hypothetical protein